jgi:hypothetical protein
MDFPCLQKVLADVSAGAGTDILSPLGVNLVCTSRDKDDIDDTIDNIEDTPATLGTSLEPDLEDAAAAEDANYSKHDPCFEFSGQHVYKSQFLKQAFAEHKNPNSTDRLKRVANIP